MASGATLRAFQRQYDALRQDIDAYEIVHKTLTRALRTYLSRLGRLRSLSGQILRQRNADCGADSLDHIYPLLMQKVLDRLTYLIHATIPSIVEELRTAAKSMQTVKRQAEELNSRLQRTTSDAMMAYSIGPIPSIRRCVDGIVEIVAMYDRETRICELIAGRESVWLDGVAFICLESGGPDNCRAILDIYEELVCVLEGLENRKMNISASLVETMHVVLSTIEA